MKKSKLFGSILALTLALVPTVGTIASNNSSCSNSITASAAARGCYRVNSGRKVLALGIEPYTGRPYVHDYPGAFYVPTGAYVSSNGYEACGCIRITYAGQTGYLPKSNLTWYAS